MRIIILKLMSRLTRREKNLLWICGLVLTLSCCQNLQSPEYTPSPSVASLTRPSNDVPTLTETIAVAEENRLESTSTPLLSPTLSPTDEGLVLSSLLIPEDDCQLPCWWGFKLDENTLSDVESFFIAKNIHKWEIIELDANRGRMGRINLGYPHPTDPYYQIDLTASFLSLSDGSLDMIRIVSQRPSSDLAEKQFFEDWNPYRLDRFLSKYGKPSYVLIALLNPAEPTPPLYSLSLSYEELGIQMSYSLEGQFLEDFHEQICLDYENVLDIEILLYRPEIASEFSDLYFLTVNQLENSERFMWERRTGETVDEFYENYRDSENLNCVELDKLGQ